MQAQGPLNYAIIDEVDSILVDEARTPLIISGPAFDDVKKYAEADRIARLLRKGDHFEVKEKERTAHLNDDGIREAEKIAGVESFYTPGNMEWPHLIDNALKAHHLYRRDRDYVVMNGEIIIVDEFTGRLMTGRQWSDGLHQAVEAKEKVQIKEENQTLATITLQNFFKLYKKLSGMTGTAMTEANEFWKVYHLDVIAIPTNRGLTRVSEPDVIFRTDREKYHEIIEEIKKYHETGRPILVGTTSIEKSELIADMLAKFGITHQVLNAKYPRERGRDRRPGRPQGDGHDRHQHGRSRHRHHPRRQPRVHGLGRPEAAERRGRPPALPDPAGSPARRLEGGRRQVRARDEGRGARGRRPGRPAHHRHRAPRVAPDRQPASRPVRPPGRPRLVAVLPVAGRRADAEVRRRVGLGRPHPPGHGGERGHRVEDGLAAASRGARRRSRSATSTPARTSSNTTRSWTSSGSGSTASASGSWTATRRRTRCST